MHIHYIDEVISTNHYLAHLPKMRSLPDGYMVATDFQRDGRGQSENFWESEAGKNILCSVWFELKELEPVKQYYISKAAAVACCEMLDFLGPELSIKWPNDIYFKDRKLGGILIENSITGNAINSTIVGIGINVNQIAFSDDLPNPVSLAQITGEDFNIQNLLKGLQLCLMHWFEVLNDKQVELIDEAYVDRLYRKNGSWFFKASNEVFKGEIIGILPSGQLVLKTEQGRRTFWFKEVEFIID